MCANDNLNCNYCRRYINRSYRNILSVKWVLLLWWYLTLSYHCKKLGYLLPRPRTVVRRKAWIWQSCSVHPAAGFEEAEKSEIRKDGAIIRPYRKALKVESEEKQTQSPNQLQLLWTGGRHMGESVSIEVERGLWIIFLLKTWRATARVPCLFCNRIIKGQRRKHLLEHLLCQPLQEK